MTTNYPIKRTLETHKKKNMDNNNYRERYKDREIWLKESSDGMLCVALGKATDKPITLKKTADGVYAAIVFENIVIHSWFSNFGVNADNEEPGTPDIVLPLYTWAKCAEIRDAANLLYKEKGIHVVTDNILSTSEACSLAGLPEFDLTKELEKIELKSSAEDEKQNVKKGATADFLSLLFGNDSPYLKKEYVEIADFALKGMNEILHPEFSIHRNNVSNEIYIKANHQAVKDVEEQSPLFKDKIQSIVDFFYNDAAVQEKFHSS